MAKDRELAEEQQFLDRAYESLAAMQEEARRMLESVLDLGRGGTFQSRTERDIVVRTSLARLAQLDVGDQALCFGRIDRLPEDGQPVGESFHIGRIAVSGPEHEPLVVDWRAPVAEPFYRATGLDPQGLARRRHLAVHRRTVTGLEDEYFATPGADGAIPLPPAEAATAPDELDESVMLGGPGALLAAISQPRTGHMGDIVATIQREQDEIIRSPLGGLLLVQGGPGTGKTAVALHRAAYLLYTYRFPLERQGVLVLGPNPLFLRYIEQVLPSLGESGVTLSTVSGLVPEIRVSGSDSPAIARLKGEARMARVLARAVRSRERPLRYDLVVPFGATNLGLSAEESARIVTAARRRPGPHNARRGFVEQQVTRVLAEQYGRYRQAASGAAAPGERRPPEEGGEPADRAPGDQLDLADVARQLRRQPVVAEALDRMWPRLAPHELLHDLLGARPLLAAAGRGVLDPAEQSSLYRPRSPSLDAVPWTAADVALVDEARMVLGPHRARRPARERSERARREGPPAPLGLELVSALAANGNGSPGVEGEEVRAYGHIVVDEVQHLSPMQLRMVARRSLSGSMTAVGDIAQATGPWAPAHWSEVTGHLAPRRAPRLAELTVSYRTPLEVARVAAPVLAAAAPGVTPPRPVRRSGFEPVDLEVAAPALAEGAAALAADQLASVAPGRVAMLAPAVLVGDLARALSARGLEAVDPRDPAGQGLAAPLVLLPVDEASGLEFDGVVVVEPALIAAAGEPPGEGPPTASTRGLRLLYVALTRATRRLAVVRSGPWPAGLGAG